ncbi:Hypothetical_protein [Hexamita inflata]|uniref:Hypothetical_protein n=1 Tax=Hexamita inflata TaxID=28002 RepID=A0AA86PB06_9EUKA|nr:Hypothetical protein HINF_LOCUS22985 [Hexamita inflata]
MRQKYTQEQNEAFYLDAAKMYQEAFGVNNCISPSGQVVKEVFFPAYRDRFGYGLGLFTIKEEAKRMRDGITKFFKARFVEKMEHYTDKGIAFEQIMFRVTSEFEPYMLRSDIDNAVLLFKKSLDKQIVQLQNSHVESPRELVSNLNAQIQSQMIRSQARPDAGQSFVAQLQDILDANSHRTEGARKGAASATFNWCERIAVAVIYYYLNSSEQDQISGRRQICKSSGVQLKQIFAKLLKISEISQGQMQRGRRIRIRLLGALPSPFCSSCVFFVLSWRGTCFAVTESASEAKARLDAKLDRFSLSLIFHIRWP